jgi:hypothetical protein
MNSVHYTTYQHDMHDKKYRTEGERKFVLMMVGLGVVCATILYVFLFISLWRYKELVGVSLLLVLVVVVGVYLRGRLVEQRLRQVRYHHHTEIPLDWQGEPYYWPQDAQENPNHGVLPMVRPRAASPDEGCYYCWSSCSP